MGIPIGVEEDLSVWLSDVLNDHGALARAEATRVGQGTGFMGQLARVKLHWAEARPDAPASVIVKMPATDPQSRMIGQMTGMFDREARFYNELVGGIPVRVPKCFHCTADAAADQYALVLEDLAPMRNGDQVEGASLGDASLIVRDLARLHAAFYRPGALDGLDWIPGLIGPSTGMIVPMFEGSWPAFQEHYGARLTPKVLGWTEAFAPKIPTWMEGFADLPTTLVHGDFRLDNMFFGDDGSFALIDWQSYMRVPGSSDLVYFLLTNLTTEMRRAHEQELITLYLDTLRADGIGEDLLPREMLERGYIEGAMMFAVMFVSTIAYQRANDRGEAFFDALVDRTFTAVEDLDAGTWLGL